MKNRPISVFLNSLGIAGVEQQAIARAVLENERYTRAGRINMAVHKEAAAEESLDARLAFHCSTPTCRQSLQNQESDAASPRRLIQVERGACEVCEGSADRRALAEMAIAMTEAGLSRAVVVGGTDQKAARIRDLSPPSIRWRFVGGLGNINQRDAGSDLRWADVVVIWATTPLPHRVSNLYSKADHTITSPTSGIATLAREAAEFARRQAQRRATTTG